MVGYFYVKRRIKQKFRSENLGSSQGNSASFQTSEMCDLDLRIELISLQRKRFPMAQDLRLSLKGIG